MKSKGNRWPSIEDVLKSPVGKLNAHLAPENSEEQPKETKKGNKMGAKRTEVNGITFDSKREAGRYKELLLLLKAGEIAFLELQVPFELNPGGSHTLTYTCDFKYVTKEGETVIEDCKGFKTRDYLKRRRLMLKVHGIKILET